MSSSDELQKSMVIDKSNHLSFKMLAKNFILDLLTWGLYTVLRLLSNTQKAFLLGRS